MMIDGKKSISSKLVYEALKKIAETTGEKEIDVFNKALENVEPAVAVTSRRVGRATYRVATDTR